MGLRDKQRVFIEEYLIDFNATRAALAAGYSENTAAVIGHENLKKPNISEEIKRRISDKAMNADEVLTRLADIARGDIADLLHITPSGYVVELMERDDNGDMVVKDKTKLIKKIKQKVTTVIGKKSSDDDKEIIETEFELYSALDALRLIGQSVGLYKSVTELNNGDGVYGGESDFTFSLPAYAIAPSFYDVYRDLLDHKHTEYVFKGGRGSTKSSFVSEVIIELLINNPEMHALVGRQVKDTLRDSVYSQLVWAINYLGLSDKFHCTTNPLEITYIPTGQKIYFRGGDDPLKIKSIKPKFGFIGILWLEELDQFRGPEAVRSIIQSAIRGGDRAYIFESFNPPRTRNNWVNKELELPNPNRYVHESNYLTVPSDWLGKTFIEIAEHLKEVNQPAYDHEYLGIANVEGGLVFPNTQLRKITDEEIAQFDHVCHGLDFGYFPDPAHYSRTHYDAARLTLYIYGEVRRWRTRNRELYDALVEYGLTPDNLLICDSAEPKSVADFKAYGANARGAEKGPDSVKYRIKWMQSLVAIVIDPERAPYSAQEFLNYEYEQDKDGNYISEYPDKDNHAIDSAGYGNNLIWRRRGQ